MSATEAAPALRVVSGGQTGVDRAALDAALELSLPCGGWCPRGRLAEDGRIPARYPLDETPDADPAERTAWNVRDADATLILAHGPLRGGTALARACSEREGRPLRVVDLAEPPPAGDVRAWIRGVGARVLNVAGPRESESPGIQAAAFAYLLEVLDG
jgi:hypothetical protein